MALGFANPGHQDGSGRQLSRADREAAHGPHAPESKTAPDLGAAGVPPGHYPILVSLLDSSPATVSQLAAAEHVRVPSMTALLGQMETEG